MRPTLKIVDECIAKLKLPMDRFRFTRQDLLQGMRVELEHGKITPISNITDDDKIMTFKIALAHVLEYPDYYERLEKMEQQAEKYWKNKSKTKY